MLLGVILHKLNLFWRKWGGGNHTQDTSLRSSPKKNSQKAQRIFSHRLYFTPAVSSKNLHHRQSRFWPISFASYVTLRCFTYLYLRNRKRRLRTSRYVNNANTLSKQSNNPGPPGKDQPGKWDSCPLEQRGSATAPPWEQEGQGVLIIVRKIWTHSWKQKSDGTWLGVMIQEPLQNKLHVCASLEQENLGLSVEVCSKCMYRWLLP